MIAFLATVAAYVQHARTCIVFWAVACGPWTSFPTNHFVYSKVVNLILISVILWKVHPWHFSGHSKDDVWSLQMFMLFFMPRGYMPIHPSRPQGDLSSYGWNTSSNRIFMWLQMVQALNESSWKIRWLVITILKIIQTPRRTRFCTRWPIFFQ